MDKELSMFQYVSICLDRFEPTNMGASTHFHDPVAHHAFLAGHESFPIDDTNN